MSLSAKRNLAIALRLTSTTNLRGKCISTKTREKISSKKVASPIAFVEILEPWSDEDPSVVYPVSRIPSIDSDAVDVVTASVVLPSIDDYGSY